MGQLCGFVDDCGLVQVCHGLGYHGLDYVCFFEMVVVLYSFFGGDPLRSIRPLLRGVAACGFVVHDESGKVEFTGFISLILP